MRKYNSFIYILAGFIIILSQSCSLKNKVPEESGKEIISLDDSPSGRPYSPAVKIGNTLYLSGQIAVDMNTGSVIDGGIEEQTTQVMNNIKALVEKAGFSMSDIVRCNVLLKDIEYYAPMNKVYSTYFESNPPARKAFAVEDLPLGALVEIDAVAIK